MKNDLPQVFRRLRAADLLKTAICILGLFSISTVSIADDFETAKLKNWHQWRGPNATGSAPFGKPPLKWDDKTNIKWKTAIPGVGSSTPIVWGNRIFLLSTVKTNRVDSKKPKPENQPRRFWGIKFPNRFHKFYVVCVNRQNGLILWKTKVRESVPHEGTHPYNDFASGSPVTNGKFLYASFGSNGVYCLDMQGKVLWKRDLGKMKTRRSYGEGTSPALYKNRLVVNFDHEGDSFIEVLDATTGKTVWKKERDEPTSWATPLVVEHHGVAQIITNAKNFTRSYDLNSGKLLWQCPGQTLNSIPSPIHQNDVVFCMSGYRGNAAFAIPLSKRGKLSATNDPRWTYNKDTPYVSSPLLYQNTLYFTKALSGIMTAIDSRTGAVQIPRTRLPELETVYASPVAAGDRVYFTSRKGTTLVIAHRGEFKPLAINKIHDPMDASPAIVGNQIFLRGQKFLYCIEELTTK